MKTQQELLDIVYTYYPRGINLEDVDKHVNTPEYQLRLKACEKGRESKPVWSSFKDDLKLSLNRYKGGFDDYTTLGAVPAFYACAFIGDFLTNHKISAIDIVISVIAPFWTYRYAHLDFGYKFTFPQNHEIELGLIADIDALIRNHFNGYQYLPEQLHQIKLNDVTTAYTASSEATIFNALFID